MCIGTKSNTKVTNWPLYRPPSSVLQSLAEKENIASTPITTTSNASLSTTKISSCKTSASVQKAKKTCSKPIIKEAKKVIDNEDQHRHYPRLIVKHDYHDHANDPLYEPHHNSGNQLQQQHNNINNIPSFPTKLYEVLELLTADKNQNNYRHDSKELDIMQWQPHGRCFIILEPQLLKELILPKYFHLDKIQSFQRNLNLYGFKRITQGPDKNSYYHECFLRGRPDLLAAISRKKIKGTNVRAKSNPDDEPNFWLSYPWMTKTAKIVPSVIASSSSSTVPATTNLPDYDKVIPQQPRSSVSFIQHSIVSDDDDDDDENDYRGNDIQADDFSEEVLRSKLLELVADVDMVTSSSLSEEVVREDSYLINSLQSITEYNDTERLHGWGKPFYSVSDDDYFIYTMQNDTMM